MELDILHLNSLASRRAACRLKHDLVVESQSQLGHTTEVAFHLDGTENLTPQHISVGADEEVQAFDNIEEDFVLAVTDTFGSPRHGVGHGDWRAGLDLELV